MYERNEALRHARLPTNAPASEKSRLIQDFDMGHERGPLSPLTSKAKALFQRDYGL